MIFIVHSKTSAASVGRQLGLAEYSYYFVLKEFRPLLERLGIVVAVDDPEIEVDRIYQNALKHGERCLFLSFSPPQQTPVGNRCPTIPIFAWEFDTIPTEPFDDEPRNDWRFVFSRLGRAITHSNFTVDVVRAVMGPDFPIVSIPAPVWDRHAALYHRSRGRVDGRVGDLAISGTVVDSRRIDLELYTPQRYAAGKCPEPASIGLRPGERLRLDGIVYTAVFSPYDGRKNWFDMVSAFCWTFRETEDATLVLKLTHRDSREALVEMLRYLRKLTPFKCRVVLMDSYLSEEDYQSLVLATTYVVNTSHGEGQCLPLMEFMSAGRPAIAPRNSAMLDYITEGNAFVVASDVEPTQWPHDPRGAYRTFRHRLEFDSLMDAYRRSYALATERPEAYAAMSACASARLETHCSERVVADRLVRFLGLDVEKREQEVVGLRAAS